MWRVRRFFKSIHNLIRWFPVIWKDKDWDQHYLYLILLTKIRHMRKRNEKITFYMGHEIEAKWMRVCERLIENLTESNYWKDEYDNKPLNVRNLDFIKADYRNLLLKAGCYQDIREEKAKRLLFKILEWQIDSWWD